MTEISGTSPAADTLLVGRYRLLRPRAVDAETGSGDLWRAQDETLARPVAVRLLAGDDPRAPALLAAAGRAGQVSNTLIASVLDAAEDHDFAFVVGEWVDGDSIGTHLRSYGPFDPPRATAIILDTARVLAAVHGRGLAHLRLHPDNVLVTRAGEVKVTDLEIAAALAGIDPGAGDPRAADARWLGRLLYASLTARWPRTADAAADALGKGLAMAPVTDGRPASPRQVRAGVPRDLDAIVDRALSVPPRRGLDPIRSPSAMVAALSALPQTRPGDEERATELNLTTTTGPSRTRRALGIAVPLAAVITVGVIAWLAGLAIGRVPGPDRSFSSSSTGSPAPGGHNVAIPIPANGIRDFDPEGDGTENPDQVALAHDRDPSTAWETSAYRNRPDLGGLKSGVGLLVDLGRRRSVSSVDLLLTGAGADVELRVAPGPATTADGYRVVAAASDAGRHPEGNRPRGTVTLTPTGAPVTGRYWLIWFTKVPEVDGLYSDGVAEVSFHG